MLSRIRPALTPRQWQLRSAGNCLLVVVGNEVRLVVHEPSDDVVSISDADQLWSVIALGNEALPDSDPRKITRADLRLLRELVESAEMHGPGGDELRPLVETLSQKIAALLPSRDEGRA